MGVRTRNFTIRCQRESHRPTRHIQHHRKKTNPLSRVPFSQQPTHTLTRCQLEMSVMICPSRTSRCASPYFWAPPATHWCRAQLDAAFSRPAARGEAGQWRGCYNLHAQHAFIPPSFQSPTDPSGTSSLQQNLSNRPSAPYTSFWVLGAGPPPPRPACPKHSPVVYLTRELT